MLVFPGFGDITWEIAWEPKKWLKYHVFRISPLRLQYNILFTGNEGMIALQNRDLINCPMSGTMDTRSFASLVHVRDFSNSLSVVQQ